MSHNPNPNNFGSGGRYGPPQSYGPPRQMYGQAPQQNYSVPSSHNPYNQHPPTSLEYGNKSTVLAYVLWFFLGGIGVHKFYLGQIKQGICYAGLTLTNLYLMYGLGIVTPIGIVLLVAFIIDLFTMPKRVQAVNEGTARDTFNILE